MKKEYKAPKVIVLSLGATTVIAASMTLDRNVVSDLDELAVKSNAWGDIWDNDCEETYWD